jgi:RNA polymerase subunit RPABC4/transcription elongation factor Spt4
MAGRAPAKVRSPELSYRNGSVGRGRAPSFLPLPSPTSGRQACRKMKFKDPAQARCPACGHTSERPVDDLLARRAKCSRCGRLLAELSERMHHQRDAWRELVIAAHLALWIERQVTPLRIDLDKIDFGRSTACKILLP